MALIECTDCGGPVSTAASTCPKCGNPVNSLTSTDGTSAKPYTPFWIPSRIAGVFFIFLAIGAAALFFINKDSLLGGGYSAQIDPNRVVSLVPLFWLILYLLIVGISLIAGIARYFTRIGLTMFFILLLPYGILAWIPFIIPPLKAGRAKRLATKNRV